MNMRTLQSFQPVRSGPQGSPCISDDDDNDASDDVLIRWYTKVMKWLQGYDDPVGGGGCGGDAIPKPSNCTVMVVIIMTMISIYRYSISLANSEIFT